MIIAHKIRSKATNSRWAQKKQSIDIQQFDKYRLRRINLKKYLAKNIQWKRWKMKESKASNLCF